jgi:alkylhydroperoxidase family enzyme
MVGLTHDEITSSRKAQSGDTKTSSALRFARAVNTNRGQVTETDVQTVRDAGFSDAEIAEIVAHVALNVLTNYFNNTTHPTVDFPRVSPSLQAA